MADRKKVAEKDGVHRTTRVTVEPGYVLAPGYEFAAPDEKEQEIGDTGRITVFRVCPSDAQSAGPRFLGRWDDGPAQCLDIDLVDRHDRVVRGRPPYGHHPKTLPGRRFDVALGLDETTIVFTGIIEVALGYRMLPKGGGITFGGGADVVFRRASATSPSEGDKP